MNLRYLQKVRRAPNLGATSVGVSQVIRRCLITLAGLRHHRRNPPENDFTPPSLGGLCAAPASGRSRSPCCCLSTHDWITVASARSSNRSGPRLLTLLQQPRKLALGVGGICCSTSAVRLPHRALRVGLRRFSAAGGYRRGVPGRCHPRTGRAPGGLGAVEAALSAGLTAAAGIPGGLAVSSVLLFRLVTFWLPTIPGWFSFNALQKAELL